MNINIIIHAVINIFICEYLIIFKFLCEDTDHKFTRNFLVKRTHIFCLLVFFINSDDTYFQALTEFKLWFHYFVFVNFFTDTSKNIASYKFITKNDIVD